MVAVITYIAISVIHDVSPHYGMLKSACVCKDTYQERIIAVDHIVIYAQ